MKQLPINEATAAQMRAFAAAVLEIDVPKFTNKETALERIRESWPHDYIFVEGDEADEPEDPPVAQDPNSDAVHPIEFDEAADSEELSEVELHAPQAAPEKLVNNPIPIAGPVKATKADTRAPLDEPRYEIRIESTETPGGSEPVPVGVNGSALWIPRDKPCIVAQRYVEVLQRAKQSVYDPVDDAGNLHERVVPLYPVTILAGPFQLSPEQKQQILRRQKEYEQSRRETIQTVTAA